jgi:Putative adhesin
MQIFHFHQLNRTDAMASIDRRVNMKNIALVILAAALPALAQEKTLSCNDRGNHGSTITHCEMREQPAGFAGRLNVDASTNGGVTVKGWDNGGVLVRARVEAWAADEGSAASVSSQVRVDVSAGQVSASGPASNGESGWSVSYEVFVPRRADLNVKANNGGIAISDVAGTIQFETKNGGVSLKRLAGDVEGKTMNGGLNVELAGARWEGAKLDARTKNGGVNISVPENYSAHFETATVNGRVNIDFPMTVHGEISKKLATDLGSGGATVHVETTNGAVNVKRAAI